MDEAVRDIAHLYAEAEAILDKAQAAYKATLDILNNRLATEGPMKIGDEAEVEKEMFSRKESGKLFVIERVSIQMGWFGKAEIVASGPIIKQDGQPGRRIGRRALEVEL